MANENEKKVTKTTTKKSTTTKKATTTSKTKETPKTKKETPKKTVAKKTTTKKKKAVPVVEENHNNRYFSSLMFVMIALSIIFFVSSYAFFTYERSGNKQNVMYAANLNIIVDDNEDLGINEQNAFPVYDEVGRQSDPYSFTLKNLGSVAANYRLMLVPDADAIEEDGCSDNLLDEKSVMFQLIKDGTVIVEDTIASVSGNRYIIDEGFIGLTEEVNSYDYELRLWISAAAGKEVMGRHYHGRVDVEIIDPANS